MRACVSSWMSSFSSRTRTVLVAAELDASLDETARRAKRARLEGRGQTCHEGPRRDLVRAREVRPEDVVFVDVEEVELARATVLADHGGQAGVRDRGLLESAVHAPRTGYYASLAELANAHGLMSWRVRGASWFALK